jgi:hypothetical protein
VFFMMQSAWRICNNLVCFGHFLSEVFVQQAFADRRVALAPFVASLATLSVVCGAALAASSAAREPASQSIAALGGMVASDRIIVRFEDALSVRLREGVLHEDARGALAPGGELFGKLPQGEWIRVHHVSDESLERQRQLAIKNIERRKARGDTRGVQPLPDLRNEYILVLSEGVSVEQAIDQLRALPGVARATPMPLPAPSPLPPDFRPQQGYMNAAPVGSNVQQLWSYPGGRGSEVTIANVEYSFNAAHEDLPPIVRVGLAGIDPFNDNNHGTAVFGILLGKDNNWGVVGGAPDAKGRFACANYATGWNVAAGITSAADALQPGDVILIEQQLWGPNSPPAYVTGMVPVEWQVSAYDATRQAVNAGITVVATGANGEQNLDAPIYSTGNDGHWPFLPENDSGAIFVGAGAAGAGFNPSSTPRSRLWYSSYGSRMNVQGWGERIFTTGYGDAFSAEGVNRRYTANFGGTSGAGPIVASAAAALSSIYESVEQTAIDPWTLRDAIQSSATPQQSGGFPASQRIGGLIDAPGALAVLFAQDCDSNSVPDRIEIAMNALLDSNNDLVLDACQASCDSIDFNGDGLFPDDTDLIDFLSVLAGGACGTGSCNDIDFNNDELFPDDSDLIAFLSVLAGGAC